MLVYVMLGEFNWQTKNTEPEFFSDKQTAAQLRNTATRSCKAANKPPGCC